MKRTLPPIKMTVSHFHEVYPALSEAEIMMVRTMAVLDVPERLAMWVADRLTTSDQIREVTEWTERNIELLEKTDFRSLVESVEVVSSDNVPRQLSRSARSAAVAILYGHM